MPTKQETTEPTIGDQFVMVEGGKPLQPIPSPPHSLERQAFLDGLMKELRVAFEHYRHLARELGELQARMIIAERNLCLTRDHLKATLSNTNEGIPEHWDEVMQKIRFVGARIGDACAQVLQEHPGSTTEEILRYLNTGELRFRTGTPLREINGALLRQTDVYRNEDKWFYESSKGGAKDIQRV